MTNFSSANTKYDPQHFKACDSLRQHCIQARAALLDCGEVEPCRIADSLSQIGDMVRFGGIGLHVIVGSWNRGVLPHGNARNGLWERVPEVGIAGAAAIPSKPCGIH